MRNSFPKAGNKNGVVLSATINGIVLQLIADPNHYVRKVRLVMTNSADEDAFVYTEGDSRSSGLMVPANNGSREEIFSVGEDATYSLSLSVVADDAPSNNGVVRFDLCPYEYGGKRR